MNDPEFLKTVAKQIHQCANPDLDKEAVWKEITTGLGGEDRLNDTEAESLFYGLPDEEREIIRLNTLIVRAALLLALMRQESPAMVLGELAGSMLDGELETIAELFRSAGMN